MYTDGEKVPTETGRRVIMTPYQLAKRADIRPQHAYNLVRQGLIPATRILCEGCGRETLDITDEDAATYLERRAERQAAKATA